MASITTLNPTTELEAVNAILATIGEAPVSTVEGNTAADVQMAVAALRTAQKEVLSRRWRFNTEVGYEVDPTANYVWPTDGRTLNIFEVPEGLASFDLTHTEDQRGLDVIIRPSRRYPDQGDSVLVFYDRLNARDGFPAEERSVLKINPVWLLEFEFCPEPARRYITIVAARRFQTQMTKSEVLDAVTEDEEALAQQILMEGELVSAAPSQSGGRLSETDAVNQLLGSLGLPAIASVEAAQTPQSTRALNMLRQAVREVCAEGWVFNTEHGFEVKPFDTFEWENQYGETYELNVFRAPDRLISFEVTPVRWQQGDQYVDLGVRNSRDYQYEGQSVLIFCDRETNSDGFWGREALWIDPVWNLEFDELPEEAKHYALVTAALRFAGEHSPYTERDKAMAWRSLKRKWGWVDSSLNIFNQASTRRVFGGRPMGPSGVPEWRATSR